VAQRRRARPCASYGVRVGRVGPELDGPGASAARACALEGALVFARGHARRQAPWIRAPTQSLEIAVARS
jgi:hypothetical protein